MKTRKKMYIVEYYFNEHKHWAEVYQDWTSACDTMKTIINKYTLYKIELVVLNDRI